MRMSTGGVSNRQKRTKRKRDFTSLFLCAGVYHPGGGSGGFILTITTITIITIISFDSSQKTAKEEKKYD